MKKALLSFLLFIFHFSLCHSQHHVLYGCTGGGGKDSYGIIYRYDPTNDKFDTLYSFDKTTIGGTEMGGVIQASNGLLYGSTNYFGANNDGTFFSFNASTNKPKILFAFNGPNGRNNYGQGFIMQATDSLLYSTTELGGIVDSGVLFSYNIYTGRDSVLFNFTNTTGSAPNRTLIKDTSTGLFYGTTWVGGDSNEGTIYCYNPKTGAESIVHNFDSTGQMGCRPAGMTFCLAANGIFYGMTAYGGSMTHGTIYSFNPKTGKYTVLVRPIYTTEVAPWINNFIQASDGLLYALVGDGGSYFFSGKSGVLFSFDTSANTETVLHNFGGPGDGYQPIGDLIQNPDDSLLYGTTQYGGKYDYGTLFSYNIKTQKLKILVSFNDTMGAYPWNAPTLVLDTFKIDTIYKAPNGIKGIANNEVGVKVFPNPSNGKFIVQALGEKEKMEIEIYNTLGEKVYTGEILNRKEIDLSDRPSGVYLYRIITKKGDLITLGKLIIE